MQAVADRSWLEVITEQALGLVRPSAEQALDVLGSGDDMLMDVVAAASRVRRAFFGNRVKLNYLVNMKSGLCGEDCAYCSQRRGPSTGVLRYSWLAPEAAALEAERAAEHGAKRVCLVASGRAPTERDLDRVASTIAAVRARRPELEVCICVGILGPGQAERLRSAGADAYNHNLNTAESHYGQICSTHGFSDRVRTLHSAAGAGLSPCSGVIVGMGESNEQIVDVALRLSELGPESVPVNFLMPFPGTPLAGRNDLTPAKCLRVLAMFRFVFPDVELRMAGGREMHLRSLQPLGLQIANSIFLGDYLTSEGAPALDDLQMIADAGFVVEGPGEQTLPPHRREVVPALRRRGPGSALPSNA
ncbi:MAG: biotin synthase BioB [Actinobacteria bacterium]|nr:biotin synthase BioB [Actinomycetota bacterium]